MIYIRTCREFPGLDLLYFPQILHSTPPHKPGSLEHLKHVDDPCEPQTICVNRVIPGTFFCFSMLFFFSFSSSSGMVKKKKISSSSPRLSIPHPTRKLLMPAIPDRASEQFRPETNISDWRGPTQPKRYCCTDRVGTQ